ncbi:MAG TPA: carboxypeptidase regulatory-like domain-containing protein, partial [bacterium]|nr:carboxypeptidase regulatory-like domain-containing protein [bacterium]
LETTEEVQGVQTEEQEKQTKLRCRMKDLESLYAAVSTELICLLEKEITYFANLQYGSESEQYEDDDAQTGVRGTVRDVESGDTISNAKVSLQGTDISTKSDADGAFRIPDIKAKDYRLEVSASGYKSKEIPIKVVQEKMLVVSVNLESGSDDDGGGGYQYPGSTPYTPPAAGSGTQILNYQGGGAGGPALSGFRGGAGGEEPSMGSQNLGGGSIPLGEQTISSSTTGALQGQFLKQSMGSMPDKQYTAGKIYTDITKTAQPQRILDVATEQLIADGIFDREKIPGIIFDFVYYPVQLMAAIEALVATLTESLSQFNYDDFHSKYNELLKVATEYRRRIQSNLSNPQYEPQGHEEETLDHLTTLVNSCDLKKFQALMASYQERFKEVQEIREFLHYLKDHPGLEHQAGVPRGGTFILVYDRDNRVIADFSLPYVCCSDCPPITVCESRQAVFQLPKQTFCSDDDTEYRFILDPPGGEVSGPGVTRDEATGDYYFSPSHEDVPPEQAQFEYTVQGETHSLSVTIIQMEADFTFTVQSVDMETAEATVKFTAQPDDAEDYAWSLPGAPESPNTNPEYTHTFTDISGGDTRIDVTLTATKGDCSSEVTKQVVIEHCSAAFTPTQDSIDYGDVTYTFSPNDTGADAYHWEFDAGRTSSDTNPQITFDRGPDQRTVEVSLHIEKGVCTDTATRTVTIPAQEEASVSLPQNEYCNQAYTDDSQFQMDPSGGRVEGSGVKEQNGDFFFHPEEVDPGSHTFTYSIDDEEATSTTVDVLAVPSPDFDVTVHGRKSDNMIFTFTNLTEGENYQYEWRYIWPGMDQPAVFSRDASPPEEIAIGIPRGRDSVTVILKATNQGEEIECSQETTQEIDLPESEGNIELPKHIYCNQQYEQPPRFIVDPPGGVAVGPGVLEQEEGYYFQPGLVEPGLHFIDYNVESWTVAYTTVMVNESPQPKFEAEILRREQENLLFRFKNTTENESYQYIWSFYHREMERETVFSEQMHPEEPTALSVPAGITQVQVILTAVDEVRDTRCENRFVRELEVPEEFIQ